MESYPIGARAFTSSPTFAFRSRLRSPIGRWTKTPVDIDTDATTVALACRLTSRYGALAITIAVAVRTRLVAFMARDIANDDGSVLHYTPDVLAFACGWPEGSGSLTDALESAGITVDGRYRHWHAIAGNASPEQHRRLIDRDRQRRHRAKHATEPAGNVTQGTVTKRDMGVTRSVTVAVPYKDRARPVAREEVERHTHSVTLRAEPETPPTPSVSPAVAILSRIWQQPVPAAVARRITAEISDADRWQRTCTAWEAAGWHLGPRAVTAMLHRYAQDADAPRQRQGKGSPRSVRAHVVTTQTAHGEPIVTEPERIIVPADREGFRRAFAGTPFGPRIATETSGGCTAVVARPLRDLATMPTTQRARVMTEMLSRIGQPS